METIINKSDLFNYLDQYSFSGKSDITMAIEDFYRENIEKDENYTPSRGEIAYFGSLAEKYMDYADYIDEGEGY